MDSIPADPDDKYSQDSETGKTGEHPAKPEAADQVEGDLQSEQEGETENVSGNSYIATIDTSAILVDNIEVGSDQDFTITFLEVGSDTIGAADITVPGAFTLSSILELIASEGKNWSYNTNGDLIELTADSSNDYLTQGESVSVTFSTLVDNDDPGAHEFETEAWQASDRNSVNNMAAGYTNPVVIVGEPVSSEADLADMAHDGHYILTNNIDLVSDWTPIRGPGTNGDAPFTGSFHGNGYTINDMNIELPSDSNSNIGMFARTEGAWLVDVILNDFSIYIDDTSDATLSYSNIGGLAGQAENTSIVNNSISGDIYIDIFNDEKITAEQIGGIVGYMDGSTISNSYADVDIVLTLDATDYNVLALYIGGLSGLSSNSEVGGSYAAGLINVHQFYTGAEESPESTLLYGVGGLLGYQGSSSTVNMSYSAVEIIGNAEGNKMDFNSIGGLVGDNQGGDITNSYALGGLELSGDSTYHGLYALGGLVGRNRDSGSIDNSYAAGTMNFLFTGEHSLEPQPSIGGLVGFNESGGTVTRSFYDSEITGQSDTGKGEPKTTAQMQQASTFSVEQWSITGGSGHYPLLWWQYDPERPQTIWHIGEAAEPGYPLLPPCTCPYSGGPGRYWSPCTTFSSSAYTKTGYDPLKYFKPVAEADKERRALPPTGGTSNRLWAALLWFAAGCAILSFSKRAALPKLAQLRINRA